jgi:hypothetical protein
MRRHWNGLTTALMLAVSTGMGMAKAYNRRKPTVVLNRRLHLSGVSDIYCEPATRIAVITQIILNFY